METLEELREEIEVTAPGPELEELERTYEVCQALAYLVEEGFVGVEKDEESEEVRLYSESECYHAPLLIEA